jgi:hypothetical protein
MTFRRTLAAKLYDSQLIMAGERIGAEFDEEIDKISRHGEIRD